MCKTDLSELRYDFCLNIITCQHEQTKQIALDWCKSRGLKNAVVRDTCEGLGWCGFSVFSSYLHSQNYLTLNDGGTEAAFKELLASLREADQNIRVQTNWRNLEKYIQLEANMTSWKTKLSSIERELGSEEQRLNQEHEVIETKDFEKDEEILFDGSDEAIAKRFRLA
jgi:hypothetical protein